MSNSSIKVVGRLDPAEAGRPEYGFLPPSQRARAVLAKPGTMFVSQPEIPVPLAVEFRSRPGRPGSRDGRPAGRRRSAQRCGPRPVRPAAGRRRRHPVLAVAVRPAAACLAVIIDRLGAEPSSPLPERGVHGDRPARRELHLARRPWAIAEQLTRVVTTAEDVGMSRVGVMDHVWQIGPLGPPEEPMLEAHDAGLPRGPHVAGRAAGLGHGRQLPRPRPARQDHQHAGRAVERAAWLGIGAAWNGEESEGLGCSSHRPPSGSSGWRRRCASACRCGATTTARSARTTAWAAR